MHKLNFTAKIFPIFCCILYLISYILLFTYPAFSQEEITITTYYPSPFGVYDEMRVDRMSIGPAYQAAVIADGQLIIEQSVGIGTAAPGALLEIVDATSDQGTMLSISGYDNDDGPFPYDIVTLTDEDGNSDFVIRAQAAGDVRVGINTAAPSATLDLQGNTNICVRIAYLGGATPCPANYDLTTPATIIQAEVPPPPFYMCCRNCPNPDNNNDGICND